MTGRGELPHQSLSLREFLLLQSECGYGGDKAVVKTEDNGSKTIEFSRGAWRFEDNYFVSEEGRTFFGRIVVYEAGKPTWYAVYDAHIDEMADPTRVYDFLKDMLRCPDADFPVRGPLFHEDEDRSLIYEIGFDNFTEPKDNTLDEFLFREVILPNDEDGGFALYSATFMGGSFS
jgi:hypothetical protein